MKKTIHLKSLWLVGLLQFLLMFSATLAQTTVINTNHTYNNSSGMIIYNVQNTNPYAIIITEFRSHALTAGVVTTVLYNPTPTTNVTTWTSGVVGAGQNGWVLAGNGTTAGSGSAVSVLSGPSLVTIPPATTYQFALSYSGCGYMSLTSGAGVNTFAGNGVNILTGDGISWGSVVAPATPANYPRGLVGGISWIPGIPPAPNDAGITGFVNPLIPTCSFNDSVSVTMKNFGSDTLTSASINWKLNTTLQTPAFWIGSLAPQQSTTVFVGTAAYIAGDNLYAWTSNPNGVIENLANTVNDSSSILGLSTGLAGPYTIGGIAPNFPDVPSAVAALNFAGVCGPVVFNLRSGTYYDQFELGQVIGMDATNTVTFRSEVGHRDSVIIDFGAAGLNNNYVVKLNNADYYRLESMTMRNSSLTYGRVVDILGGSDYNTIYDCKLHTQTSNSTSTNIVPLFSTATLDNYNTFEGNSFVGGSYGVYLNGVSTSSLEEGNVFKNNEMVDNYNYGLRISYNKNLEVTGNRVHGVSTYTSTRYGMYLNYCDGASKYTYNSIESNPTSSWTYGMYIYYCDASAAGKGLCANNSITVGSPTSTSICYGLAPYYSGFYEIYNNSVHVVGGSATSRALYLFNGGANVVKNNTFSNGTNGFAAYVVGTYAVSEMDYNNFYTATGTALNYYDVANTNTFADWQSVSGLDAHSLNVDPSFYSSYDLHVCSDSLNGKGTPIAMITDDIDLQPRNASTPDIGSDEFAPLTLPGFAGADALICTGQTVTLFAGAPSDTVVWSTNDTTNALVVSSPGIYTVTVTGACGVAIDTVAVDPSLLSYAGYLMADTMTFCSGGSVLLTSSMTANSYSWTGGSSNDSLVVTAGGTYTLNISDACGSGSESVVITENTVPVAGFTTTTSFVTFVGTNTSTGGGTTSYAWNFGDGMTSTAMSPTHIYTAPGTYWVELTVTNDCGTNTFGDSITVSTVGLEEVAGLGTVAVYPNPSTGIFQLDFNTNNDMNVAVQVTNLLGETVYVKNLGSINGTHKDAIDITNAAPGVYYVTILSDHKVMMTNMLVKQ